MQEGDFRHHIPKVTYATFIFIALLASSIFMTFTEMGLGQWHNKLVIPLWAPTFFGVTLLAILDFLLLGIAGAKIWKQDHRPDRIGALVFWFAHMASLLCFGAFLFNYAHLLMALMSSGITLIFGVLLIYLGYRTYPGAILYLLLAFVWDLYLFALSFSIFVATLWGGS